MQAQAAGGGGEGAQGLLQNPKVQIGVIAGGAIALIVVIYLLFFNNSASPAPTPSPGGPGATMGSATPSAEPTPGSDAAGGTSMPTPNGAPAGGTLPPAAGSPGLAPATPSMTGGAGGAAAPTEGAPAAGPGVPIRKNPFAQNTELKRVLDAIPVTELPPDEAAQAHHIYAEELHKPKVKGPVDDQDEDDGPPIPTMRVAGVVYGRQVSATLQIGSQYLQVTPGQMIPASNPIYRVDSIEQDTVHLSRRWEIGSRKGVQRIEVGLSARAASPGGGAFGGGPGAGYPGAGYPGAGYPGANPPVF